MVKLDGPRRWTDAQRARHRETMRKVQALKKAAKECPATVVKPTIDERIDSLIAVCLVPDGNPSRRAYETLVKVGLNMLELKKLIENRNIVDRAEELIALGMKPRQFAMVYNLSKWEDE